MIEVVPPHGPQGGRVGSGRSFCVITVAEVVAAAAETVAGFLHLRRSRRHQDAAVAITLLMVAHIQPTT